MVENYLMSDIFLQTLMNQVLTQLPLMFRLLSYYNLGVDFHTVIWYLY